MTVFRVGDRVRQEYMHQYHQRLGTITFKIPKTGTMRDDVFGVRFDATKKSTAFNSNVYGFALSPALVFMTWNSNHG